MYELEEKGYLYLLGIIPFLVLVFAYLQFWKRKKQREFGDWALVRKLSPEKSVFKPILKFTLLMLALAALVIGLVNPKIGTKMETVKREGIDIVFAVDVSKSMLAEDVAPADSTNPNRSSRRSSTNSATTALGLWLTPEARSRFYPSPPIMVWPKCSCRA